MKILDGLEVSFQIFPLKGQFFFFNTGRKKLKIFISVRVHSYFYCEKFQRNTDVIKLRNLFWASMCHIGAFIGNDFYISILCQPFQSASDRSSSDT